jgi:predicted Zn-dependent protease|tara:strand:- start:2510 stop:2887 length:378 start_codon:yes stop_codon:yes gene_type:complete
MAGRMMKRDSFDFELSFFKGLYKRMPKDVRVVSMLAHLYTQTGQLDEGLRLDRKLARLTPEDPTVHYNLACSLALKGRKADALKALRTAITFGYDDYVWMCNDPDLTDLHEYSAFLKLCDELGIA